MKKFKYIKGTSVEQAATALGATAKIIAGGTDLLGVMKDDINPTYPETLVDIKDIPDLDYIKEEEGILKIGALTRLSDIAENTTVKTAYGSLAEAALKVATPQIREMGTIGGNLCQEVRCWYYRSPENRFDCLRKGGASCYALIGDARYHSIFGSARVNLTPCSIACPAKINIPDYMNRMREGDIAGAARIILEDNPLPAITGRVCPHSCESSCNRSNHDESVSIRCIERSVGEYILTNPEILGKREKDIGKKVAIIGSGPAGLSAAYYLNKHGYTVAVFEKMDKVGGLLTYGIPPFRLPKDIVARQIYVLRKSGIEFNTGVKNVDVSKVSDNYDAVLIACGAWKERRSGIKGEHLLKSGMQFLREINIGKNQISGRKMAVIGGGNAAIDVARTLRRLGVEPTLIYRRGREEMPALKEEIEKAEQEGIEIQLLTLPITAVEKGGGIALKCVKNMLGSADETGRPRPEPIPGSEFTIEFDTVFQALGEEPDLSIVPAVYRDSNGKLKIDISSNHLGDNIFAGGDFVNGPSTVIQAIAAGKRASDNIHAHLGGEIRKDHSECGWKGTVKFSSAYLGKTGRVIAPELSAHERIRNLNTEDIGNLKFEAVVEEVNRCFNCGCVAINASDIAPVLIALGANIRTTKRVIPADKFFTVDGYRTTVLADNEIITEIQVPAPVLGTRQIFTKFAIRQSIEFALVSVAAAITVSNEKVSDARIILGAVAPVPYRAVDAENILKGKSVNLALAEAAGAAAVKNAISLLNNEYKIQISRVLVKRAILELLGLEQH